MRPVPLAVLFAAAGLLRRPHDRDHVASGAAPWQRRAQRPRRSAAQHLADGVECPRAAADGGLVEHPAVFSTRWDDGVFRAPARPGGHHDARDPRERQSAARLQRGVLSFVCSQRAVGVLPDLHNLAPPRLRVRRRPRVRVCAVPDGAARARPGPLGVLDAAHPRGASLCIFRIGARRWLVLFAASWVMQALGVRRTTCSTCRCSSFSGCCGSWPAASGWPCWRVWRSCGWRRQP